MRVRPILFAFCLLAGLSVVLLASPSSGMATARATQKCEDVEFGRPPEGGAYEIRATGAGCDVAREVARTTKARRLGPEIAQRKRSYGSHGFHCIGIEPNWLAGLPPIRYTCKRDGAKITFNREVLY